MTEKNWFQPFEFSKWELLLMRVGLALVVWFSFPDRIDYQSQPDPVGLGHLINFGFLANDTVHLVVKILLGVALLVYVHGRYALPAMAVTLFACIAHGTLDNSQGSASHHYQIVALVVLAQFVAYLWPRSESNAHARAAWWSIQTIAATYFVTAFTKIAASGFPGWILKARHYPLQLEKTRLSEHYNRLGNDPGASWWELFLGKIGAPLVDAFVASPLLCQAALAIGLLLEMIAVTALFRKGWAFFVGVAIIGLHLSISAVMNLDFRWNMALLFVFFVNLPGVVGWAARKRALKS